MKSSNKFVIYCNVCNKNEAHYKGPHHFVSYLFCPIFIYRARCDSVTFLFFTVYYSYLLDKTILVVYKER